MPTWLCAPEKALFAVAAQHLVRLGLELGLHIPGFCIGSGASRSAGLAALIQVLDFLKYNTGHQTFQHLIWITEFEGKDFLRNVNCRDITGEPYTARLLHPCVHGTAG